MADIRIVPGSSKMLFTSSLNYVETITQDPSGSITLYGSGSTGRTDIFSVDGNNGRLFSVSDDLSDSLYSVNTIAGLPVIEAFSDNRVNIGTYSSEAIKVSGSFAHMTGSLLGTASFANVAGATLTAVTFNNGGSGAASGTTFNGSIARTISYNTVGAPSTGGTGATGTWAIDISGYAATAGTATSAVTATNATNIAVTDTTTSGVVMYPTFVSTTSGNSVLRVDSTGLRFMPTDQALDLGTIGKLYAGTIFGSSAASGSGGQSSITLGSGISINSLSGLTLNVGTSTNVLALSGAIHMPNVGSATTSDVLYYNSSTKVVTYGAAPSGGGGSGTVNSGVGGKVAYYPSTAATVDDAVDLYWDNTNSRLGVGSSASTPTNRLHVAEASATLYAARITNSTGGGTGAILAEGTSGNAASNGIVQISSLGAANSAINLVLTSSAASNQTMFRAIHGSTTIFAISGSRVGVNTAAPSNGTLEVNGNVFATSFTGSIQGTSSWATNVVNNGVTSVGGTGTVNGITLTGTVTSTGNLTLGGTLGSIANSQLSNSTISGISLGSNLATLTIGTGLTGTSYNGSTGVTIAVGTVAIANGGTGQTTAGAAINALLPSQTSKSGSFLSTDGTNPIWTPVSAGGGGSGTVNSGAAGYVAYYPSAATTVDDAGQLYWDNTNSRLGIKRGTSPQYTLDVSQSIAVNGFKGLYAVSNDNMYANIRVMGNESTVNQDGMYIGYTSTGTTAGHTRLYAGSTTPRIFINGNGNTSIGASANTSPSYPLEVSGEIYASGNIIAYSDQSVKDNVTTIPNALDKVQAMRGVTFTRNDEKDKERVHAGVIAQEMEKAFPEVVFENPDGTKAVAYGNIVSVLIEAIKEQQKQIDDLKQQIEELL